MRHIFILLFIVISIIKANAQTPRKDIQGDSLHRVSMVKLIANPEKYHDKKVNIIGFLHYGFEDSALYLTIEHSRLNSHENAIWIDFADNVLVKPLGEGTANLKDANRKYVSLIGYFDMNSNGHFGNYAGTINGVARIYTLED